MASIERIPAVLQEEILHLLPSYALVNFKRVCKDWNQLISSQRFIQKHLHRSKSGYNRTLIISLSKLEIIVYFDPTGKKIPRSIPYPPGFFLKNTMILGSCDGLVCLLGLNRKDFALINPSTGKCHVHTTDKFVFSLSQSFWFGKHPSTGEYLIIAIGELSNGMIQVHQISKAKLYSKCFSTPLISYSIFYTKPILLMNLALHFYGHTVVDNTEFQFVVFAYDIEKNKLLKIAAPTETCFDVTLGTINGCLSAIIRTNFLREKFELWIMKEYGVEKSWTKRCEIEGLPKCLDLYRLGFVSDDDLLLEAGNYKKDVEYWHSGNVHICQNYYSAAVSVDSLVSPSLV